MFPVDFDECFRNLFLDLPPILEVDLVPDNDDVRLPIAILENLVTESAYLQAARRKRSDRHPDDFLTSANHPKTFSEGRGRMDERAFRPDSEMRPSPGTSGSETPEIARRRVTPSAVAVSGENSLSDMHSLNRAVSGVRLGDVAILERMLELRIRLGPGRTSKDADG